MSFFARPKKWIESVKGKQPFFAYITPNAARAPLDVPDEYFRRYQGQGARSRGEFATELIENIDETLGRCLAKLKEWGISDNTLVIFMTDERRHCEGVQQFSTPGCAEQELAVSGRHARAVFCGDGPRGSSGGGRRGALTAGIDILPRRWRNSAGAQLNGRSVKPSRRPQPAAAAEESRKPIGPTGFLARTLAAGRKGRPRNRNRRLLDSRPAIHAGEQSRILRSQRDAGRKAAMSSPIVRTSRRNARGLRRLVESVLPHLENENADRPERESVQGTIPHADFGQARPQLKCEARVNQT